MSDPRIGMDALSNLESVVTNLENAVENAIESEDLLKEAMVFRKKSDNRKWSEVSLNKELIRKNTE